MKNMLRIVKGYNTAEKRGNISRELWGESEREREKWDVHSKQG